MIKTIKIRRFDDKFPEKKPSNHVHDVNYKIFEQYVQKCQISKLQRKSRIKSVNQINLTCLLLDLKKSDKN